MKPFLLTLALPSFFLCVSGSAEKCWNLHGTCRGKCGKNEKFFLFCKSGKPCREANLQPCATAMYSLQSC
uniref:Beta-defensin n=1 Tax=Equus asinus asinus TaxID=83772 RepID=A0A8C4L235_EQUAS